MKKILVAVMLAAAVGLSLPAFAQQSAAPTPAPNPTAGPTPAVPQQPGGISGNGQGFVGNGNQPTLTGGYDAVNGRVRPNYSDTTGRQEVVSAPSADSSAAPSLYKNLALNTTVLDVKTSPGNLYGWSQFNPGNATCYIQFFNVLASSVSLGSTAPDFVIGAGTLANNNIAPLAALWRFGTQLSVAATTTTTGSSACNVAQVLELQYK